jgi:hypothetical protein
VSDKGEEHGNVGVSEGVTGNVARRFVKIHRFNKTINKVCGFLNDGDAKYCNGGRWQ